MEQLKENIIKEVKKHFDQVLDDEDEEKCNYLYFQDLEDLYEYYCEDFLNKYYDREDFIPIDDVLFRETYGDFNWFDALKIIKKFDTEMGGGWDDYDDEEKVWNYLCYVCALDGNDFLKNEEYKIWYNVINQRQKFIDDCGSKINDTREGMDKLVKFQYNIQNEYFVNLRLFRIDKATELLQVINLVYQKRLQICEETMKEGLYIKRCKHFKELYNELLAFKQRAIKLKD
jgi:hypothetical protein